MDRSLSNGPILFQRELPFSEVQYGDGLQFYFQATSGFSVRRRKVRICVPPLLGDVVAAKAKENPVAHPVWTRGHRKNRYYYIPVDTLDDLTEIADFARVELEEPERPLSKAERHAYQVLLGRAFRHAVLEPLGDLHCHAVAWRNEPLKGARSVTEAVKQLKETKLHRA